MKQREPNLQKDITWATVMSVGSSIFISWYIGVTDMFLYTLIVLITLVCSYLGPIVTKNWQRERGKNGFIVLTVCLLGLVVFVLPNLPLPLQEEQTTALVMSGLLGIGYSFYIENRFWRFYN